MFKLNPSNKTHIFIQQVVGFDGSTTIAEFLNDLILEIGGRPVELSGFTIHSDDPIDKELDHALHLEDKVNSYFLNLIHKDFTTYVFSRMM